MLRVHVEYITGIASQRWLASIDARDPGATHRSLRHASGRTSDSRASSATLIRRRGQAVTDQRPGSQDTQSPLPAAWAVAVNALKVPRNALGLPR